MGLKTDISILGKSVTNVAIRGRLSDDYVRRGNVGHGLGFGSFGDLCEMLIMLNDVHTMPSRTGEHQHVPERHGGALFPALPGRLGSQLPAVVIEVQPST